MSYVQAATPTYIPMTLGGGSYTGISPVQTMNDFKNGTDVLARRIVVKSWDKKGAVGVNNGYARIVTPFRAVHSAGDFLSRKNYAFGVPNPINSYHAGAYVRQIGGTPNQSDGTGVPSGNSHSTYVYDSSDYTRYRKLRAINRNYNDNSNGGDESNASYTALRGVVGGKN